MVLFLFVVFFFFKQKTAYEMRISDWSSDVCSSDLHLSVSEDRAIVARHVHRADPRSLSSVHRRFAHPPDCDLHDLSGLRARAAVPMGHLGARRWFDLLGLPTTSEERRVGEESASTSSPRWSP